MGGGIPWLSNLEKTLEQEPVVRISGIMNGTTNYILDRMHTGGGSFSAALAQAGLTFEKAEVVKGEDEVADCDVLVIGMGASGATGNNVSGMSVAAYVNIEGTGLGFALTSGRLAGANAAAASKSFRPLPKVVRFKA